MAKKNNSTGKKKMTEVDKRTIQDKPDFIYIFGKDSFRGLR